MWFSSEYPGGRWNLGHLIPAFLEMTVIEKYSLSSKPGNCAIATSGFE